MSVSWVSAPLKCLKLPASLSCSTHQNTAHSYDWTYFTFDLDKFHIKYFFLILFWVGVVQWSCNFVHLGLKLPDRYIRSCLQHVQYCLQLVAALCVQTYFVHLFVPHPLHFCSSPTSLEKSKGFHNFLLHLLLNPLVIGAGNVFLPCHLPIISGHHLRAFLCMYWSHDVNFTFGKMKMMYFQQMIWWWKAGNCICL